MGVEFNILWFEDTEEWYHAIKEDIESYLKKKNFITSFLRYENSEQLFKMETFGVYDLIFVDLKLDRGTKGTDVIKEIRRRDVLSDVLFYSSDGIDRIKNEQGTEWLEGVYFSPREENLFLEKAKQLIDKAVRRMEDVLSTRGMLVDSLTEFDEKFRWIIETCYDNFSDESKKNELDDYAYKLVTEQICKNKKKCESLRQERFLMFALRKTYFIDSAKLAQIVHHILKKYYPQYNCDKNFFEVYLKEIIVERNNLAHAKRKVETDVFCCEKNGKEIVYDAKKCSEIRSSINKFDDKIKEIRSFLEVNLCGCISSQKEES